MLLKRLLVLDLKGLKFSRRRAVEHGHFSRLLYEAEASLDLAEAEPGQGHCGLGQAGRGQGQDRRVPAEGQERPQSGLKQTTHTHRHTYASIGLLILIKLVFFFGV